MIRSSDDHKPARASCAHPEKRRRRKGTALTLAQCRLRGNQVAARLAILIARKPAAADAFSHMYAPVLVLP
jgi:hypothetical protein